MLCSLKNLFAHFSFMSFYYVPYRRNDRASCISHRSLFFYLYKEIPAFVLKIVVVKKLRILLSIGTIHPLTCFQLDLIFCSYCGSLLILSAYALASAITSLCSRWSWMLSPYSYQGAYSQPFLSACCVNPSSFPILSYNPLSNGSF